MPTREEIDKQLIDFLAENQREKRADRVTNQRVLEALDELKKAVDSRFYVLEHRLTGVEARVDKLDAKKPTSLPPSEGLKRDLGVYRTGTGSFKVPEHELFELFEQHTNAETWKGLRNNLARVIVGVAIAVLSLGVLAVATAVITQAVRSPAATHTIAP